MEATRRSARTAARILIVMTLAVAGLLGTAGQAAAGFPPKPDEPLTAGMIYPPSVTAPTMYQKFFLTPGLSLTIHVKIPIWKGVFDIVQYAKQSPFTEKWHVDVVKAGPDGNEVLLQKFEGLITDYQFSLSLGTDFFTKHGPGKYGAKIYLGQITSQGEVTGLGTGVGFTIAEPKKPQDVTTTPSAVAAALAAATDAAKPNIVVGPAKVEITKNCKGPAPALIAAVTLKNTGGNAFAAGQARIHLRNIGGVNLEGYANVPAIGVGETITLSVPATSLQPFSSLVGSHQMELPLLPLSKVKGDNIPGGGLDFGAFRVGPLYMFTVTFPAGHCGAGSGMAPPKPSSYTPNERTNPAELNPQPEVPSKPKEKKKKPEGEGK